MTSRNPSSLSGAQTFAGEFDFPSPTRKHGGACNLKFSQSVVSDRIHRGCTTAIFWLAWPPPFTCHAPLMCVYVYVLHDKKSCRHSWSCTQNCSQVADGFTSSEESVFTIPAGSLEAGLVSHMPVERRNVRYTGHVGITLGSIITPTDQSHVAIFSCRRQVYGFSLNVSKGSADSHVAYGLLRSAVSNVRVEVSAITARASRALLPLE